MKCFLRVMMFSFFILAPVAWADGPDDTYVSIYTLIQQGDTLSEKGKTAGALAKYGEAQTALKRFQITNPGWNEKVVSYRLKYLSAKITQLQSNSPPPSAPEKALSTIPASTFAPTGPSNVATAPPPSTGVAPIAPASNNSQNQVKNLEEQIHQLESDKGLLEAKLKESLAAQPGPVNPQEFAKAQERIKQLEKDNDSLKTTLAQLKASNGGNFPVSPDAVQQELSEANRRVIQLTQDNAALVAEKTALQARVKTLGTPDEATTALRDENTLLKKQLAELKDKVASIPPQDELNRKLQETQTQLAALQSDRELLQQEKLTLQKRVEELSPAPVAATVPPTNATPIAIPPPPTNVVSIAPPVETSSVIIATNPAPSVAVVTNSTPAVLTTVVTPTPSNPPASPVMLDSVTANKLAQLEAQRDELQKNINAATKDIYGKRKGKEMAVRIQEMSRELGALRARIEVLEAHPIPYTPDELTLLAQPNTTLMAAVHTSGKKKVDEIPAGAEVLLAEAKRYFVAHELDKAEAKYLQVIKMDEKNASLLTDLASIQADLGKTAEAESNLKTALVLAPDDDYVLYTMGKMKFQEKKYDEALDSLSRAAQINPQNSTLQNLLGLTLSEKGLRGPAETAFRKAIQLDPGFTDAHINLAVVYITQQPPLAELARWHYQKALAAGHRPNPKLEKMLDPNNVPVATP